MLGLLEQDDSWIKTCALYAIATANVDSPIQLIEKLTSDADPFVRETATLTLNSLNKTP